MSSISNDDRFMSQFMITFVKVEVNVHDFSVLSNACAMKILPKLCVENVFTFSQKALTCPRKQIQKCLFRELLIMKYSVY